MTDPTKGLPVDRTVPLQGPDPSTSAADPGLIQPSEASGESVPSSTPAPTPSPTPSSTRRERRRGRGPARLGPVVVAAAVAGLVGGLAGGVLADQLIRPPEQPPAVIEAQPASQQAAPPPAAADGSIPGLSRAALPSVALISVGGDGLGSGFVIREDGYLLTNAHVIADAGPRTQITVQLPGSEPVPAEVVGADTAYDIAVLKIDRSGLPVLPFADSAAVEVGQTVVAVGAPLGLDSTVTSGIVSALDRPVVAGEASSVSYINAIQTDAAINPGNSGGPLLDLGGRVVGVNSALAQLPTSDFGRSIGSIGLGFAIPADQADRTATQLIETGRSEHPVMGVHIDMQYTGDGARVLPADREGSPPVIPGGPAEAAGVLPGDVIVSVDDTRIRDSRHLLVVLRSYRVGDTVEMTLRADDGAERTVSITLAGSEG
ncbi:S1C family serine protease [Ornithinimicrobium pratense]|uniref:Trypsin-like serine protease n=1 Tax=Ornithinimicrobium pratense TaxID=2593973 RepID=A0A5J6V5C8_9MICO|nr:trypsin-like peptidase domain-containing protein [Ornithinimicrobium pratense]QFG69190.1 trypsin-like serine protease [Ornithinimicrobium pratense]